MLDGVHQITVREASFALLREFGIDHVFGNPGSTELPMFRDFPADFEYVLGLQESVVVGMADGYAQATRNAALVNLHSAAGVGHALGNIFTAYRNQTPLIVTAGQQARSILPYGPFLGAERATEFPAPYVKWSCEPARGEDVPGALARAYYTAMQPPRGPVFLSIPVDDWDRPCEPVAPRRVGTLRTGDPVLLREAADALAAAERPAIVVGAGVAYDDAWAETIALAERHAASVWGAPMASRNGFPENHSLFRGFLPAMREPMVAMLGEHDVVVVLGGSLSAYHVEGSGPHIAPGTQLFQLVDNEAMATWAPVGHSIVTNVRAGAAALLEGAEPPIRQRVAPREKSVARPPADGGISQAYLFARLAELRPEGAPIVEEAPSSRPVLQEHLPMVARDGFYTCASGGLGHGLPAALGVALGRPGQHVIALLGDGSAMYSIQALWTAAQLDLPLTIVIVNNSRYEALYAFSRHFSIASPVGVDLPGIDFCAIARGQGVSACRLEAADALDGALLDAFATPGPSLIEVAIS